MANKIFRSLISTVLVICLMHFQTSIALAETKGVTEEKGVVKTSSDGKKSQSVAYNFSDVDESSMMATLTMIAIGLVSVSAIKCYSKLTMDMKVGLGAGATYLAGEIYSNISLKDKLDKMKIEFEKKSGESMQTQVEAFTDLKTAYTEAKKTIETKNMLQTAAAAAYGVATGIATYDYAKQKGLFAYFKTAKTGLSATLKGMVSAGDPSTKAAATMGMGLAEQIDQEINLVNGASSTPGDNVEKATTIKSLSTAVQTKFSAFVGQAKVAAVNAQAAAANYSADVELKGTFKLPACGATTTSHYVMPLKQVVAMGLYKFLINDAQANWNSIIGLLGSGAITYLGITKLSLGTYVDKLMGNPGPRILVWGALTGLTAASLSANKKVINDLDERIKKIDDILASLMNVENGAKIADSSTSKVNKSKLLTGLGSNTILANAGSSNFKMDCITSNGTKNCPSLSKAITESPEFQELPITLQNLSKQVGDLGDGFQGQSKLSDSTLAAAGELGSQNNAIQKTVKDGIEKTKKLDNNSDLDKNMKDFQDGLLAEAKKGADQVGGAKGLYASLGGIPSNSARNLNQAKNIAKESQFAPTDSKAGIVAGVNAKAKNNDFEFKLMNESKEVAGTDSPVNVDNDQLASEISKESIGSSNGPSIFEILSHRYYVSGYPKLLEEE